MRKQQWLERTFLKPQSSAFGGGALGQGVQELKQANNPRLLAGKGGQAC